MNETATLSERTARAAQWRFASAVVGAACQFTVAVLVARLLVPADVGLVAFALVIVGFVQRVGDLGIGNAVVQRADLTSRHVRTAFTFSALLGFALAGVTVAVAPLVGVLFRNPSVTSIVRAFSVLFAAQGLAVVAGALLRRRLDFRTQFLIDTTTYALGYGLLTIVLALRGFGAWSLVLGVLSQAVLTAAGQLAAVRHPVQPMFGRSELRGLLNYGFGAAAASGVNFVALNADNFIVGRWLGAASLGVYVWAYALMALPYTYAASVLSGAFFPALALVQREPERVRRAFLMLTRVTALVGGPAMAILAVGAPHLVRALYESRWLGVVVPLQLLCIGGYFRTVYHVGGIVSQSVGRVYGELWRQVLYAAMVIAGAVIGTRFGLPGVALGVDAAIVVMFVATAQLALQATGTSWSSYIRVQIGPVVVAAITSAAAIGVRLLMEAGQASSLSTAAAIVIAGGIAWAAGAARLLRDPELEPVRARLPAWLRVPLTR